jgi:hypothetical protein
MLAVISPSRDVSLGAGSSALASAGGQLIAVVGRLSTEDARQLAASRRGNAPAMALLVAVSAWAMESAAQDTTKTADILSAAGWRVAVVTASTPLASAWQVLHRPADRPLLFGGGAAAGGAGAAAGGAGAAGGMGFLGARSQEVSSGDT